MVDRAGMKYLLRLSDYLREAKKMKIKMKMKMKKSLYDLTKEDWNSLFPVELVEHNPAWKGVFEMEKKRILEKVSKDVILRIEHFGSTAIPGIRAKPYIDIIIEIPTVLLFDEKVIKDFEQLGYSYFKVPEREDIPAYMSFGKGYNLDGVKEQIYHIHMCPKDNFMWRQVEFRDYLIAHPDRARAYEQLKVDLAAKHSNDRGKYVVSKTDFIKKTLDLIK